PGAAVLSVTFLFCLLATLLFSLGPALKATKADLVNDLKQQVGEPARIGRFSRFFAPRHISVMVQIALSLMLLFAAGLFFRGALKASGLDPGFKADTVEGDETLTFSQHLACTNCGLSFDELAPRSFSFNSPYGACPHCAGLGTRFEVDPELVVPNPDMTLEEGAIAPWAGARGEYFYRVLAAVA